MKQKVSIDKPEEKDEEDQHSQATIKKSELDEVPDFDVFGKLMGSVEKYCSPELAHKLGHSLGQEMISKIPIIRLPSKQKRNFLLKEFPISDKKSFVIWCTKNRKKYEILTTLKKFEKENNKIKFNELPKDTNLKGDANGNRRIINEMIDKKILTLERGLYVKISKRVSKFME